jgi:hypothetical protein
VWCSVGSAHKGVRQCSAGSTHKGPHGVDTTPVDWYNVINGFLLTKILLTAKLLQCYKRMKKDK